MRIKYCYRHLAVCGSPQTDPHHNGAHDEDAAQGYQHLRQVFQV